MSKKDDRVEDLAPKTEPKPIASEGKSASKLQKANDGSRSQIPPRRIGFILSRPDVPLNCQEELEKKKQLILVGQLRAAESHNKIQNMRQRYRAMRADEINLLISSQSTARKAIRLEALLPPFQEEIHLKDTLNKLERKRVEEIMSDEAGVTINRTL
ncbi:protein LKAAEAR1 [Amblyraja radiata]|uniref:protein LKAAEAR1 n=1 Tax=Amblyraja radiata TaxID=386614 RepID=UPI0014035D7E|nr:protein LKAAEAR1 [Amblyraja radiata]